MTSNINAKTIARIAAIQALYQYQINGATQSTDELIAAISGYYKDSEMRNDLELTASSDPKIRLHLSYFTELTRYTTEHLSATDELITTHLSEGWTMDTLHTSLLALLRVAITELRYFPEVPYKVVINEFTDIASDLLKDNEVAFVNSMLDNLHKELKNDTPAS